MKDIVKETLGWCNSIRKEKGLEPLDDLPKGAREDMVSCPCGAATGVAVGRFYYYKTEHDGMMDITERGDKSIGPLPQAVIDFVEGFDNKHFPEYDLDMEVT